MFCSQCGAARHGVGAFCANCGAGQPVSAPLSHPQHLPANANAQIPSFQGGRNFQPNNQRASNSAAIASWVLLIFACIGSLVPGLGFAVWLIIVPILLITLVLGILAINRGSAFQGVIIILMSLIVVPAFVFCAPIISTVVAIGAASDEASESKDSNAVAPPADTESGAKDDVSVSVPTANTSADGVLNAPTPQDAASSAGASALPVDAPSAANDDTDQGNAVAAIPRFSDYPVVRTWEGVRSPVVIATAEEREHQAELSEAAQGSPNFAGEYRLTLWSCGPDCTTGAAVNLSTGQAAFLPFTQGRWNGSGDAFRYRADSRLLVVGGVLSDQGTYGAHFFEIGDDGFSLIKSVSADRSDAAP